MSVCRSRPTVDCRGARAGTRTPGLAAGRNNCGLGASPKSAGGAGACRARLGPLRRWGRSSAAHPLLMPTDVTVDIDDDVGGLGIEFVAAHRVAGRWAHVVAVQKRWRCVLIDPDDFVALHDRVAAVAPAALRVPAPVRPRPSLCSKPQRQGRDRRLALSTYLHDLVDLGHPEVTNEVLSLLQANDPSRLSVEQLAGRTDLSTWRDAAGGTLLHYAAGRADHALLDLVLAGDVDGTLPQERDQFGYVAGDVARALGHDDVASRLPAGHDDDERRRRHEVPCQYGIAPGHRRVLVVGNPVSGKGHAASVIEHVVVPLLDAAGIRHETKLTSWPGDAKSIALTFDGDRFDTLLLVSGDGLLHEVLQGLAQRDAESRTGGARRPWLRFPLAIVPAGSGNAVTCVRFGIPVDALRAVAAFVNGVYGPVDLVQCDEIGGSSLPVFSIVSVSYGFIADVDFDSEPMRWMGALRFTVEAIKKIVRGDTCACDIRYRGRDTPDQWASVDGPFNLLVASNLSHLAPDMNLIPGAKIDDGCVHLGVGRGLTRTAMLAMLAFDVEHGRHVSRDGVSLQACAEIELKPVRRSPCDIDGERYAFGSVRCIARPGAAQLILSQQAHKPV